MQKNEETERYVPAEEWQALKKRLRRINIAVVLARAATTETPELIEISEEKCRDLPGGAEILQVIRRLEAKAAAEGRHVTVDDIEHCSERVFAFE